MRAHDVHTLVLWGLCRAHLLAPWPLRSPQRAVPPAWCGSSSATALHCRSSRPARLRRSRCARASQGIWAVGAPAAGCAHLRHPPLPCQRTHIMLSRFARSVSIALRSANSRFCAQRGGEESSVTKGRGPRRDGRALHPAASPHLHVGGIRLQQVRGGARARPARAPARIAGGARPSRSQAGAEAARSTAAPCAVPGQASAAGPTSWDLRPCATSCARLSGARAPSCARWVFLGPAGDHGTDLDPLDQLNVLAQAVPSFCQPAAGDGGGGGGGGGLGGDGQASTRWRGLRVHPPSCRGARAAHAPSPRLASCSTWAARRCMRLAAQ
jgi:hypothetical protein